MRFTESLIACMAGLNGGIHPAAGCIRKTQKNTKQINRFSESKEKYEEFLLVPSHPCQFEKNKKT